MASCGKSSVRLYTTEIHPRNVLLGILSLQLLLTAVIGGIIIGVEGVKTWLYSNSWFFFLTIIASFAFLAVLLCVPGMKDQHPQNVIFLFAFTACEGVLVGCAAATYNLNEIILATVITVGVTVSLTAFALQTKIDFTIFSGVLFSVLVVLVFSGMIALFFPANRTFSLLYSSIGALLFSAYLIYDVQMIAGGHKHECGPDDYIQAALAVYLDIINLFLLILRLVGNRR